MRKKTSLSRRSLSVLVALLCATASWAQSDVTQPGDKIIASSSNSPGSEGVANAIDNTQAKYLNFDSANDAKPSGFIVTPAVGATRVTGMSITSANDAADRDPKTVILEGSNDDTFANFNSGNWTFIAGLTNIPAFTARFQKQTFSFQNLQAYKSYRWTVLNTAGPSTCCMQVSEVELLGATLPPDVTQPGDPILASSSNSPGSEGVANAIDNTQAKYLNFDSANDAKTSGFAVTPKIGATVVSGMTITSANDAADRDPKTVILEGSNDDTITSFNSGTWTFIVGVTNIPAFATRFQKQTFLFDNVRPYKSYRWTVLNTAGPSTCCMQVSEVELLGTSAPKDVTQPGDKILASSSNSPGSEGVANAIDNTQAKYLNFDSANDAKTSGFVVSPAIGATVVTGMSIQSANDAADRDPKTIILEGSNDDTVSSFNSGNWTFVAGLTNIPAFTARFQTQQFFFPNSTAYKHYRWTVLNTAGPSTCCMQVAEVELLAVTASNPCDQTAFTLSPVDTPALADTPATFYAKVNGPWTVQWLKNGVPIPGANQLQYSTDPMTAAIATNGYSIAIVGCQTSQVVHASIFAPSATKSIGVSFVGGGANGAPTTMNTNDIAGVQAQAFWNNAPGQSGGIPDPNDPSSGALKDSDDKDSTITFTYQSGHSWGAGTGTDTPTERMLNGLIGENGPGTTDTLEFDNVTAGSHAVLIYAVSPPLQFQEVRYTIKGATTQTYYMRVMNSDEYKPAPGFYRSVSTDVKNPTIGDFVRFDDVKPDANGAIVLETETLTPGFDRYTGVNAIQLVLNAPNPGAPPTITADPQPSVAPTNGTVALTVTATGNNLTYQWRKNGVNLPNGGHVSGAQTSTLTITPVTSADSGVYNVAVFNAAGSTVSKNATVGISKYDIKDALAAYFKLDETSGTTAANAVTGGKNGTVTGTPNWVKGQVGNAFSFDGTSSYIYVSDYTKATKAISASAWVNVPAGTAQDVVIVQNAQPALTVSGGATRIVGQFSLRAVSDPNTGALNPSASIGIGPNVATATGTAAFPTGGWHQVAFSADGAQLRLYVDGAEVARTDYLADINPPDIPYITIGAALNVVDPADPTVLGPDSAAPDFLAGPADEVAVWDRALTASEVKAVYDAEKAGNPLTSVVETPPTNEQRPTLVVSHSGTTFGLTWTGTGFRLQSADTVNGTFADVAGATASPYSTTINASTKAKFYRLIK